MQKTMQVLERLRFPVGRIIPLRPRKLTVSVETEDKSRSAVVEYTIAQMKGTTALYEDKVIGDPGLFHIKLTPGLQVVTQVEIVNTSGQVLTVSHRVRL